MKWQADALRTYPDGMSLRHLTTYPDLDQLGKAQHHCSGAHYLWVREGVDYWFVLAKPDGTPGSTLYSKDVDWVGVKHPIDDSEEMAEWKRKTGWSWLHSTYYDQHVDGQEPISALYGYEQSFAQAKAYYDELKRKAIKVAPLGKDHPMKAQLDRANRDVTHCRTILEAATRSQRVRRGRTFNFQGTNLVVLELSGRGIDYDGNNTRYTEKWDEFLGSEVEVTFGAAKHYAPA